MPEDSGLEPCRGTITARISRSLECSIRVPNQCTGVPHNLVIRASDLDIVTRGAHGLQHMGRVA